MAKKSSSKGNRKPNIVDAHIGLRVRERRAMIGMTQEHLAEGLGLTFQQVQKYEKGSNRIGASRLWQLAALMSVPITYFFEGLDGGAAAAEVDIGQAKVARFIAQQNGMLVIELWDKFPAELRAGIIGGGRAFLGYKGPK